MSTPYYTDGQVTLYHGDCREIPEWQTADLLVTDPPYGIAWKPTAYGGSRTAVGIVHDDSTAMRDEVLQLYGTDRPGVVFGSPAVKEPAGTRHRAIWAKPPDSGIFGAYAGWRRDWEAIYLIGAWPARPAQWSAILRSNVTSLAVYTKRGHPHGKPVDLMEEILHRSPPGSVADPFCGSGSTLLAARNAGRAAVGCEVEERFCELTARRLDQGVLDFGEVTA